MNNRSRNTAAVLLLALMICAGASVAAQAQAGTVDRGFQSGIFVGGTWKVYAMERQADGKMVVGGWFSILNGHPTYHVGRLNPDATVDRSFYVPPLGAENVPLGAENIIRSMAIQPDGKILVAAITPGSYVKRLNSDGSPDASFSMNVTSLVYPTISDIEIDSQGRILLAGDFRCQVPGGAVLSHILRLNPDGSTDTTFAPAGDFLPTHDIEIQPDGRIIGPLTNGGGTDRFIKRFFPDGSEDTSFNALVRGNVNTLKLTGDGDILIGGDFTFVNNAARVDVARLSADGALDQSFQVATSQINSYINDVEIDLSGNILLGGRFTTINGTPRMNFVRVDHNGNIDPSFTAETSFADFVNIIIPLPDGPIVFSMGEISNQDMVMRVNLDGSDTTRFGLVGGRSTVFALGVQSTGKVIAGGVFTFADSFLRRVLVRLDPDGNADPSFAPFSEVLDTRQLSVTDIAVLPDDKILAAGAFHSSLTGGSHGPVIRLLPDGVIDTSFLASVPGPDRVGRAIAVEPDGNIVLAYVRNSSDPRVVRLLANGTPDPGFTTAFADALCLALQSDGKILIGGSFGAVNGVPRGRIARLNADGTLDESFNPLGAANAAVRAIAVQPDGRILIAGDFTSYNGTVRDRIARILPDGDLDPTFVAGADNIVRTMILEDSGKILIAGDFTLINGTSRFRMARLGPDGELDISFSNGTGADASVHALELTPDGKVLAGGGFMVFDDYTTLGVARLFNSVLKTNFDFDGDGRADVAVYRPGAGDWHQLLSGTGGYRVSHWGQEGDKLAPGDYDGDGKADVAVFRDSVPGGGSAGYFFIHNSSDESIVATQFGSTGDLPVIGDWDGDGKADIAVYRDGAAQGGQSYFYYRPSGSAGVNFVALAWGATGDKPLVGDYDGDGKLDAAVFRPSNANWYILRSSDGQFSQTAFGLSSDIPVPADYDGDGRTNIAVYRPSTGYWYTSQDPQTNFGGVHFGLAGDIPSPADYDGDGKADVCVFRPSNGSWYILRSSAGFTSVHFGTAGDRPVSSAFVH